MSSFANEKLSLYLRTKMGLFATRVRAIELLGHLPCLTPTDKEEIQAKKDFSGNFIAMQLLMDYLQKRLNWAEQLIIALDRLEHHDLAEDLRIEWNKWNQIRPSPTSPAVLPVARSNVHPAPPTSPSPALSERSGDSPPSLVHRVQPVNPPGPTPNAAPLPVVADQPVASPPASLSPVVAAPPPASPSPVVAAPPPASASPVVLNPPVSAPPSSPTGSASVQKPVKRPVQDTSPPTARVITVQQEAVGHSVPVANEVTEEDQHTVSLQSPRSQQPPPQLRDRQFSHPPQGQQSSPAPEGAVCSSMDNEDQFASKPGILISGIQNLGSPTGLSPISEEPYSGDSGRLEISESGPESDAAPVGACSGVAPPQTGLATAGSPGPVTSDPVTTASPPLCQENGFAEGTLSHSEGPMNKQLSEPLPLSHNEPEENTYDSNCLSSLGNQEVLFNVVHVSEEASILNNEGQTTSMLGNNVFSASEPPPPVKKHDSQSQITPAFLSTDPDSLSGPNQDQREDSLVNFVNKPLEFQSPCLNIIDNGPSTNQPGSAIPPAIGTTVSGSSSHDNRNPQPAVAGVMPKNWKQEKVVASGVGIYYLLGAAFVSISLLVAWRMKK